MIAGLIASLPATLSVIGSGWLADRMARTDARSYATIPAVSMLLAAPLYILAVTRETAPAAIALLALAATVQYTYLGPSQGVFQNLMHPRMRASSYAVVGIIYALVGGGLGPLLVGALSDHFALGSGEAGGLTIGTGRHRASLSLGGGPFLRRAAPYPRRARAAALIRRSPGSRCSDCN